MKKIYKVNLFDARSILSAVLIPVEIPACFWHSPQQRFAVTQFSFPLQETAQGKLEQFLSQLYVGKTLCKICHFAF